jgi:hypothetical protein
MRYIFLVNAHFGWYGALPRKIQVVRTIVTDNLPRRNSDAGFPGIGEGNVLSRNVFLLMDDIFCNFQI